VCVLTLRRRVKTSTAALANTGLLYYRSCASECHVGQACWKGHNSKYAFTNTNLSTHTCAHTHTHIHAHTPIHTHTHTHTHTYIHTLTPIHTRTHNHNNNHAFMALSYLGDSKTVLIPGPILMFSSFSTFAAVFCKHFHKFTLTYLHMYTYTNTPT